MKITKNDFRQLFLFIFSFIGIFAIVFYVLTLDRDKRVNSILNNEIKDIKILYKFILNDFENIAKTQYESIKNDKKIIALFNTINNGSRDELYGYIKPSYERLKEQGVINLNFLDKENKVVLRMDKKDIYNDIDDLRFTTKYTKMYKKGSKGFEQGKFKHAFSYVFPLFNSANEYIGCIDFGFSTKYMQKLFTQSLDIHSHLLINKNMLKFSSNPDSFDYNYLESIEHKDYYFATFESNNMENVKRMHQAIIDPLYEDIKTKVLVKDDFALLSLVDNSAIVVTFIPIKNIKENKKSAYLVSYKINEEIINLYSDYTRLVFISFIGIFVFLIFVFKNFRQKENLQKQVEEKTKKILEQKEIFETLYRKSTDGVVLMKNRRFLDCNEAVLNMFNYSSKKEFLKTNLIKLFHKNQGYGVSLKQKFKHHLTQIKNNDKVTTEWKCVSYSGKVFWVDMVLTKIKQNNKDIIHVVLRDITDRKKLEIEVEKKSLELATEGLKLQNLNMTLEKRVKNEVEENRKKDQYLLHQSRLAQMGEMISMIAHQWRQPLSAISATTNNLTLKLMFNELDDNILKKEIKLIAGYSQHLSQTIDEFRNFFKDTKTKQSVTLEEIIKGTLDIVNKSLENKNITIHTKYECNKTLETYSTELKQVVLNLVKNAEDVLIEQNIEYPYIYIETKCVDDKVYLIVKDNAGGIPEDIINKIFDPYFSTKIEKDGTGLGLYMSKTIIEDHCNGKIEVTNDEDGAVFTIELLES